MRGSRLFGAVLLAIWLVAAALVTRLGLEYYRTPLAERAFAGGHELLKPSGPVGHAYGIAGTLMMAIGVSLYSLRKRLPVLARAGKLGYWLQFHIFLCTLGPFFVLLHTTLKFGGIVSIAFWSMVTVVASGVFGRYVFARIPKAMDGRFRGLEEIEARVAELDREVGRAGAVAVDRLEGLLAGPAVRPPRGTLDALWLALQGDLANRRHIGRSRRELTRAGLPDAVRRRTLDLVRRKLALQQQSRLLLPFQRMFSYWHLLHVPLAIVLLIVTIVHVAVAIAFGYTWLF